MGRVLAGTIVPFAIHIPRVFPPLHAPCDKPNPDEKTSSLADFLNHLFLNADCPHEVALQVFHELNDG
jgi:hypothetical protein